MMCDYIKYDYY